MRQLIAGLVNTVDPNSLITLTFFAGSSGALMLPGNPIKGFSVFAWTVILIYITLVCDETIKNNNYAFERVFLASCGSWT